MDTVTIIYYDECKQNDYLKKRIPFYLWAYIVSIIICFSVVSFCSYIEFDLIEYALFLRIRCVYFGARLNFTRIFLFLHVFFNFFSLYISKVNTTHYWMMMNISIDKTESFENDSLVIFMHNTTCSISWSWFQFLFFFDPYFNFILIV